MIQRYSSISRYVFHHKRARKIGFTYSPLCLTASKPSVQYTPAKEEAKPLETKLQTLIVQQQPPLINAALRSSYNSPVACQKPIGSKNISRSGFYLPPRNEKRHNGRKTLLLDLDETLVHSVFHPVKDARINLTVTDAKGKTNIYVLVRPGVELFLERMSKLYEIVIFTASLPSYANPLLNMLDTGRHIAFRLYREHCTVTPNGFVKDLSNLGRDSKDVILVDNSAVSYSLQVTNAIPIVSWYGDKNDRELYSLIPFLEALAKVDDVKPAVRRVTMRGRIDYAKAVEILKSFANEEATSQDYYVQKKQQQRQAIINNWLKTDSEPPASVKQESRELRKSVKESPTVKPVRLIPSLVQPAKFTGNFEYYYQKHNEVPTPTINIRNEKMEKAEPHKFHKVQPKKVVTFKNHADYNTPKRKPLHYKEEITPEKSSDSSRIVRKHRSMVRPVHLGTMECGIDNEFNTKTIDTVPYHYLPKQSRMHSIDKMSERQIQLNKCGGFSFTPARISTGSANKPQYTEQSTTDITQETMWTRRITGAIGDRRSYDFDTVNKNGWTRDLGQQNGIVLKPKLLRTYTLDNY